jgi:rhomboid protease GluP
LGGGAGRDLLHLGYESPPGSRVGRGLVWALIGLCVLFELILQAADWGLWGLLPMRNGYYVGFWPQLLQGWPGNYKLQPYTMFVTYGFFHVNFMHLFGNMMVLHILGRLVLRRVSTRGFVILYMGALLGGAGGYALLSFTLMPMMGASGAIFGLAGGLLAWMYVDRYTHHEGVLPVFQAVVLLIVLNLIMWWWMGGLAWQAHLGGFVSGWILAMLIDPRPRAPSPPNRS